MKIKLRKESSSQDQETKKEKNQEEKARTLRKTQERTLKETCPFHLLKKKNLKEKSKRIKEERKRLEEMTDLLKIVIIIKAHLLLKKTLDQDLKETEKRSKRKEDRTDIHHHQTLQFKNKDLVKELKVKEKKVKNPDKMEIEIGTKIKMKTKTKDYLEEAKDHLTNKETMEIKNLTDLKPDNKKEDLIKTVDPNHKRNFRNRNLKIINGLTVVKMNGVLRNNKDNKEEDDFCFKIFEIELNDCIILFLSLFKFCCKINYYIY